MDKLNMVIGSKNTNKYAIDLNKNSIALGTVNSGKTLHIKRMLNLIAESNRKKNIVLFSKNTEDIDIEKGLLESIDRYTDVEKFTLFIKAINLEIDIRKDEIHKYHKKSMVELEKSKEVDYNVNDTLNDIYILIDDFSILYSKIKNKNKFIAKEFMSNLKRIIKFGESLNIFLHITGYNVTLDLLLFNDNINTQSYAFNQIILFNDLNKFNDAQKIYTIDENIQNSFILYRNVLFLVKDKFILIDKFSNK